MLMNINVNINNKTNKLLVLKNQNNKFFSSTNIEDFNEQTDYRSYGEVVSYGDGVA